MYTYLRRVTQKSPPCWVTYTKLSQNKGVFLPRGGIKKLSPVRKERGHRRITFIEMSFIHRTKHVDMVWDDA